ncbi:MAG: hypothetical protein ACYDCN_09685 [Bacteroidia bacterium]
MKKIITKVAAFILMMGLTTANAQGDNKEKKKDERKEKREVRKEDKNHGRHVDNKLKKREEKHRVKSTE